MLDDFVDSLNYSERSAVDVLKSASLFRITSSSKMENSRNMGISNVDVVELNGITDANRIEPLSSGGSASRCRRGSLRSHVGGSQKALVCPFGISSNLFQS